MTAPSQPVEKIDMRGWPASLVEVAEVIGPEAALLLVHHFAGTELYVPATPPADHPIHVIGAEAMAALCERYAGDCIQVPTLYAARSKKAMMAALKGSNRAVARQLGITERWARKVRREVSQPSLFDVKQD